MVKVEFGEATKNRWILGKEAIVSIAGDESVSLFSSRVSWFFGGSVRWEGFAGNTAWVGGSSEKNLAN
jgi:hypothetical protein